MLCENCGKNYANVKYTQIINGHKKEISLCEECSKKLGIGDISFNMPIDFSSFFGDFADEFENDLIPSLGIEKQLKCNNCNLTFDEFMKTGKFGCPECFDVFKIKLDPILKQIQGENRHIGRLGKINQTKPDYVQNVQETDVEEEMSEVEKLKQDLKKAIKEENYEQAAKIRDEIKKLENK